MLNEHDIKDMAPAATGLKFDKEKPRLDLIDTGFLNTLGDVLGFGANKYAAHNWREGIHY